MIQTFTLQPGITLRCFPDDRFKQGLLCVQFIRPMCRQEAALNTLIPSILIRGTQTAPDLRAITKKLDDLYGAGTGCITRRVGDYQATGLAMRFISDRYAMDGDTILEPAIDFLGQLLFAPVLEDGCFVKSFVSGEKRNLISAIESQRNDKRAYASSQLMKKLCPKDAYGLPRMGTVSAVRKITARSAYDHYKRILKESTVELFYVGDAQPGRIAQLLGDLFQKTDRAFVPLPEQTACYPGRPGTHTEAMEIAQGKLAMGFLTPITTRDPDFATMQVLNGIFGSGMTNLLFMHIREKLSLCYDIGSSYQATKGILTVSAGIDCDKYDLVRTQVLEQLEICRNNAFPEDMFLAAKEGVISGLLAVHDSPVAIEGYYGNGVLSGMTMTPEAYMEAIRSVTREQVAAAAQTLQLHTTYFLKGVS